MDIMCCPENIVDPVEDVECNKNRKVDNSETSVYVHAEPFVVA